MFSQIDGYVQDKVSSVSLLWKDIGAQNCILFIIDREMEKLLDKFLLTDVAKAFGYLLHALIISKLRAYGFDYPSLNLIYSYLQGTR